MFLGRGSRASSLLQGDLVSSSFLEQSVQRIQQRIIWAGEIDACLRHAAQEQVKGSAQLLITEVGQALAQEPPQGDQVDQVLQVVMLAGERLQQPLTAVVGGIRATPVGFVDGDVPTPLVLEGQVDKALDKAAQGVELQPCCRFAQRGRQTAGRVA